MNVELDPQDKQDLEELARQSGKPLGEVLRQLIRDALRMRTKNDAPPKAEERPEQSCYDLAVKAGIVGMVNGGPADLSTNPKHLAGFGEN